MSSPCKKSTVRVWHGSEDPPPHITVPVSFQLAARDTLFCKLSTQLSNLQHNLEVISKSQTGSTGGNSQFLNRSQCDVSSRRQSQHLALSALPTTHSAPQDADRVVAEGVRSCELMLPLSRNMQFHTAIPHLPALGSGIQSCCFLSICLAIKIH